MDIGCSHFLVRISDGATFMDALSKARKKSEQRNAEKYMVIIPQVVRRLEGNDFKIPPATTQDLREFGQEYFTSKDQHEEYQYFAKYDMADLMYVFNSKEINFYPNILVIQKSLKNEGLFSIFTHVYGKIQTNKNDNVQEVNVWNGSHFRDDCNGGIVKDTKELSCFFSNKMSDLNGEPMVFATFNYPPYSVLEYNVSGNIENFEDGIEMRIAILLAQRMNFTWSLYVDAENFWGEIWDNGSGNGMLGAVSSEKADLAFAAIYLWEHEHDFVDYSETYVRSGITVLAPHPLPLPQWITPLLPFSKSLWIAVFIGVFLAAIALFTLARIHKYINISKEPADRYCDPSECLLRAIGLLALAPDPTPPPDSQTGLRQLLLVWLPVWGLLLATAYSAGLSSALAIPHSQPPIDTISQLAESQLPWAATHPAWAFSLRGATDPIHRTLLNNFKVMNEKELHAHSMGRSIAYAVERLPAGNFAVGSYLQGKALEHLRLMHEDLYYEYVVTALQKSSPLRPPLDSLVGRLCAAGIPLYWEGAVSRRFPIMGAKYVGRKLPTPAPTALTIRVLQGPFYLLCIGLTLSLLIFIGEQIYKPKN
ncbi:hypothetical protein J437_LFUL016781 [Ladona fulva]|uniref:Ionotropic receptor n=1 Tax=Ladona fulva TaxID=123851 RepID=A0A8K0KNE4_LADFU|nr:hypothetical protein J437_LFUL016781 [Ladona fulva]